MALSIFVGKIHGASTVSFDFTSKAFEGLCYLIDTKLNPPRMDWGYEKWHEKNEKETMKLLLHLKIPLQHTNTLTMVFEGIATGIMPAHILLDACKRPYNP